MDLVRTAVDAGMKTGNLLHRTVRTVTGGRVGNELFGMKALELHVVGRKSGKRRSVMLTAPIYEPGAQVVLIASKGGDDRHPEWYKNLVANPEVELTIDGFTTSWTARTATADEKKTLWPTIVRAFKGYAQYQEKTDRDIPVVICTAAA